MKRVFSILFLVLGILSARGQAPLFSRVGPYPTRSASLADVAYGGGKYVAVGYNVILTSADDGVSWIEAKGVPKTNYTGVKFGAGRFVAVGAGGVIVSSVDGLTWTREISGTTTDVRELFYIANQFRAPVSDRTLVSSNGINWQSVPTYTPNLIAYGSGVFVAAARPEGGDDGSPPIFWRSGDGTMWTEFTPTFPTWSDPGCTTTNECYRLSSVGALMFLDGRFIADVRYVKCVPGVPTCSSADVIFTSVDAYNWVAESRLEPGTYGLGRFDRIGEHLALTTPGTGTRWFDSNLKEWLQAPRSFAAMAGTGPSVVGVGTGVWRSGNFQPPVDNWVLVGPPEERIIDVAVGESTVVGISDSSDRILVSTNELQTMEVITPTQNITLRAIDFGDRRFVAVGKDGTILRSFDGVNWTKRVANTTADLWDVVYAAGQWIAVGSNGKIVASPDASSFSLRFSGTELDLKGIAHGAGKFVAVGKAGAIVTSSDGISWNSTGDEALDLNSVAYDNGRFVATGANAVARVSPDGESWETMKIPGAVELSRVVYGHGYFIAIQPESNSYFRSTNGLSWTGVMMPDFKTLGASFSDGELWLTGEKSNFWRTQLAFTSRPTLQIAVDHLRGPILTIKPRTEGAYEIQTTRTLAPEAWQQAAILPNVEWEIVWTDESANGSTHFYRVVKQ